MMKKIILILIASLIGGCGTFLSGIQDHTNPLSVWHGPSPSNNYEGNLASFSDATYPQIEQRTIQHCSSYGWLKIKPFKYMADNSMTGTSYWKYQCNGPQVSANTPELINNPAPAISLPSKQAISIDQAKQQCKDIGYKPGTEKFGNCVLELNK